MSYARLDSEEPQGADSPGEPRGALPAANAAQVARQPASFDDASWWSYCLFMWVQGPINVGRQQRAFGKADLPRADSLNVAPMSEAVEQLYAERRAEGWRGLLKTLWVLTRSSLLVAQSLGLLDTLFGLATPLMISLLIK